MEALETQAQATQEKENAVTKQNMKYTMSSSRGIYLSWLTGRIYSTILADHEKLTIHIQDQCSTEYTLTEKAETFLEEHDDFFPASPELVIPDEMIDAELDFRHINKNPSRYGDKLMRISDAYVIQVQEQEMEEGHYLTWLNLIDGEEQQYSVQYNGELDDVFEDDTVEVTVLPLGTSSFENTDGGDTLVVVLVGCRVDNILIRQSKILSIK